MVDYGYRHAGYWHSQRSSIWSFFSLQCLLQYLPNSPPLVTVQLQAGCAHLLVSATWDLLGERTRRVHKKREVSGRLDVKRLRRRR